MGNYLRNNAEQVNFFLAVTNVYTLELMGRL